MIKLFPKKKRLSSVKRRCANKEKTFDELWEDPETRELMKQIAIARIKQLPDNFRMCFIGGKDEY